MEKLLNNWVIYAGRLEFTNNDSVEIYYDDTSIETRLITTGDVVVKTYGMGFFKTIKEEPTTKIYIPKLS